ncbi:hypothetical protein JOB18_014265 [Solea senegalensis]|uniref:Secreted protein n=1 Tax=Solea senegalensis TaxID=28829 RepID=A0AAV6QZC5_SOLSE|nr:hypothetical protein JOB18_014265 [Solea senegalensis]
MFTLEYMFLLSGTDYAVSIILLSGRYKCTVTALPSHLAVVFNAASSRKPGLVSTLHRHLRSVRCQGSHASLTGLVEAIARVCEQHLCGAPVHRRQV